MNRENKRPRISRPGGNRDENRRESTKPFGSRDGEERGARRPNRFDSDRPNREQGYGYIRDLNKERAQERTGESGNRDNNRFHRDTDRSRERGERDGNRFENRDNNRGERKPLVKRDRENNRFSDQRRPQDREHGPERREGRFQSRERSDSREGDRRRTFPREGERREGGFRGDRRENDGNREGGFRGDRRDGDSRREGGFRGNRQGDDNHREGGFRGDRRENDGNREGGFRGDRRDGDRRDGDRRREGGFNGNRRENDGNREGGFRGDRRDGDSRREGGFNGNRQGDDRQREGGFRGDRRGGDDRREHFSASPARKLFSPREEGDGGTKSVYSKKKQIEHRKKNEGLETELRLNRFIAKGGVCSRRDADELIVAGRVKVNGEVVQQVGVKVKRTDNVEVDDRMITPERRVYMVLNKPKDYVTTVEDPLERQTVMSLIEGACKERVYPVGRLDRQTTGVLLFTNDGDLAKKLTHPKYNQKKIYHVFLDKVVQSGDLDAIRKGIELEDGFIQADDVQVSEDDRTQVGIEIHSGRNRIVRRIFEHLGYQILRLDRVYFAGITKKNLPRGHWRFLTQDEVNVLKAY